MFEVVALLNDVAVVASGTLVISPGCNDSLLIGGVVVKFQFMEVEGQSFDVHVENERQKTTVTFVNLTTTGVSADIEPFQFSGKNYRIAVAMSKIGGDNPHRLMSYTIAEM